MDDNYCAPLAAILRKAHGCIYRGTDEFIDVGGEVSELRRICDNQRATISRLESELEIEQMRLVACSVVSLANTPESAAQARNMHPDYRSFACDDVARMVDREMEHRATISRLRDEVNDALRLNAEYEVDIQELHEQVTHLREYAGHKDECRLASMYQFIAIQGCDCGYDELLAALEETK